MISQNLKEKEKEKLYVSKIPEVFKIENRQTIVRKYSNKMSIKNTLKPKMTIDIRKKTHRKTVKDRQECI